VVVNQVRTGSDMRSSAMGPTYPGGLTVNFGPTLSGRDRYSCRTAGSGSACTTDRRRVARVSAT